MAVIQTYPFILICSAFCAVTGPIAPPDASLVRTSLGRTLGDSLFQQAGDLNGDGFVNVLDVAKLRGANENQEKKRGSRSVMFSEHVVIEPVSTFVLPGTTASMLFVIRNNTTPLLGYSLDIRIVSESSAVGTVTADAVSTNFFDSRNIITAGGAVRDPFFSVIQAGESDGVFINTITEDNSTVLSQAGVNDVFAQVMFNASNDACGAFRVELGPATALSDEYGSSVGFTFSPGTIVASGNPGCSIPAVSTWGLTILALLVTTTASLILRTHTKADCALDLGVFTDLRRRNPR